MSARQSRAARARAHAEAVHGRWWEHGRASLQWWRRLLARLFPRLRARYDGWVGRWYKRTLKARAHEIVTQIHDPDIAEMWRVSKKIANRRKVPE